MRALNPWVRCAFVNIFVFCVILYFDQDQDGHGEERGAGEEDGGEEERGASEYQQVFSAKFCKQEINSFLLVSYQKMSTENAK